MNKSSKIFIIVSGGYLFLLTFLLLTQPRSGYSATFGQVLFYFALFLPLWALIAGTIFIAAKHADKDWYQFAFGKRTLLWIIMFSVIVGFVSNLDYQRQIGCFVENETMYSKTKFVFGIGSMLLLLCGYYFTGNKFGSTLLIGEFVLWTVKVLFFNSSLNLFLPGYFTMTCWILRLILISKTLNNNRQT